MTILEFAQHIRQLTGTPSPIVHRPLPEDDPKQRRPDISKARRCWAGNRGWDWRRGCG